MRRRMNGVINKKWYNMLIGHKKQWNFLKSKFESDQLSHAYLFTGEKGIGKKKFAIELAKFVNCLSQDKPCDKCVNCLMIERNSFADFKIVFKENDANEIDIAQIRDVQNFLNYKSYYGSFKIVLVDDAELMNQEAQSCFLKTLEEPKGKTMIILVSSMPDMFLGTIASRCQEIKFFKPKNLPQDSEKIKSQEDILEKLLSVMDSSLAEKFKYTKSIDFEKQDLGQILEVLQKYFRGLLLSKAGVENKNPKTKKTYSMPEIKNIINLIEDINSKLLFTNLNKKLALEILLMEI